MYHVLTGCQALSGGRPIFTLSLRGCLLASEEERDQVVLLLLRQLLAEVLGHDVRRVPGGDLLVRVDDRLADELGVLALKGFVEVRADRRGRARSRERVAAAAALGREQGLARSGISLGGGGRRRRLSLPRRRLLGRRPAGLGRRAPGLGGRLTDRNFFLRLLGEDLDGSQSRHEENERSRDEPVQPSAGVLRPAPRDDERREEREDDEAACDERQADCVTCR